MLTQPKVIQVIQVKNNHFFYYYSSLTKKWVGKNYL